MTIISLAGAYKSLSVVEGVVTRISIPCLSVPRSEGRRKEAATEVFVNISLCIVS